MQNEAPGVVERFSSTLGLRATWHYVREQTSRLAIFQVSQVRLGFDVYVANRLQRRSVIIVPGITSVYHEEQSCHCTWASIEKALCNGSISMAQKHAPMLIPFDRSIGIGRDRDDIACSSNKYHSSLNSTQVHAQERNSLLLREIATQMRTLRSHCILTSDRRVLKRLVKFNSRLPLFYGAAFSESSVILSF